MEKKTFEELIAENFRNDSLLTQMKVEKLLKQVREATIAEAVEFCVSQDWIKTIDNLKRLPKDRIYQFENKRD